MLALGCRGLLIGAELQCEVRKGCPVWPALSGRKLLLINNLFLISWLIQ